VLGLTHVAQKKIRKATGFLAAGCFVLGTLLGSPAQALCPNFGLPNGSEIVELDTTSGQICLQLLRADAPLTVINFIAYTIRGDYDGVIIHRSVPGFVIQGGAFRATADSLSVVPTAAPIQNEPCTPAAGETTCDVRGNERGTIAMARGAAVNSATNQFFINLADNRNPLDSSNQGFTVFGNVLGSGMTVADDIAALPRAGQDEGWWLAPQIGSALRELPLQSAVPFFPTPFGCWDPTDLGVVVQPSNPFQGIVDPVLGTGFWPVSLACGTQIPFESFTEDPGPPSCPDNDRLTTGVTGMNSFEIRYDPGPPALLQHEFTCQDMEEALEERALWRDDYGARLRPQLVLIHSASYQTVPEPGMALALAAGALALSAVAHSRRRRLSL